MWRHAGQSEPGNEANLLSSGGKGVIYLLSASDVTMTSLESICSWHEVLKHCTYFLRVVLQQWEESS